jgi:hypothetical protein
MLLHLFLSLSYFQENMREREREVHEDILTSVDQCFQ